MQKVTASKIKPIPAHSTEQAPLNYWRNPETGVRENVNNWSDTAIRLYLTKRSVAH